MRKCWPAVVLGVAAAAATLSQLSTVQCDTDWADFEPNACKAVASGGGRTAGLCVPLTWCPPLAAAARGGRRPRSCGFFDVADLVCCPSADVAIQSPTPNSGTLSSRRTEVEGPWNELGCGTVVNDTGVVFNGPDGVVTLSKSAWPWMAAIFQDGKYLCGGTPLDGDTVLTAAHCFRDLGDEYGEYKIRLGALEVNETVSSHSANLTVRWIRPHKIYRLDRHYNDIAIIKTSTKASYGTHIAPVCLPTRDFKLGGEVVVLGWGHTSFGGRYARRLQEGRMTVISNRDCDDIMRHTPSYKRATPDGITEDFVCAVNPTGASACQGDSGGPLLALGPDFRWNLVGVISFGTGCGRGFRGASSRVKMFLEWIAQNRD